MLRRRIPTVVVRQAIAIVLMAIGTIALTSMTVLVVSDASVSALDALFEATSAFGTVGLSTGITARLPDAGHIVVMLLMLAGRVGPVTLATAFVVRERRRLFRYAEERPILG
jgi:Trk-type K+ transport system membrane component